MIKIEFGEMNEVIMTWYVPSTKKASPVKILIVDIYIYI